MRSPLGTLLFPLAALGACVPPSTLGYRTSGALGSPGETSIGPSAAISAPGGGLSLFVDGEHTLSDSVGIGFSGGALAMNPQAQADLRLSTSRDAPWGLTGIAGMSTVYFGGLWAGPYGGFVVRGGKPEQGFVFFGPKVNPVLGYGLAKTYLDVSLGYASDYRDRPMNWGIEATTLTNASQPGAFVWGTVQAWVRITPGRVEQPR